ncbi:hypothetical protein LEP1GSC038_4651 [Leptospira weilii str. 2006001855]|uniref:Uncharacterized protein n=1 Tax=Leptospira weilii str. 2006001855 TaxID=996804 RepID=M6FJN6_9LEPT|nr:hypothetical protein LEP1GSC038_4651 [Leptospira weilii str. 2006001855]
MGSRVFEKLILICFCFVEIAIQGVCSYRLLNFFDNSITDPDKIEYL